MNPKTIKPTYRLYPDLEKRAEAIDALHQNMERLDLENNNLFQENTELRIENAALYRELCSLQKDIAALHREKDQQNPLELSNIIIDEQGNLAEKRRTLLWVA